MVNPVFWMEARCDGFYVLGDATECEQTSIGAFFRTVGPSVKHTKAQGWKWIDDKWWCRKCATKYRQMIKENSK
jgi:hypothetical protein